MKVEEYIGLVALFQASRYGLTIQDIMNHLGRSRKTAELWRNAIDRDFGLELAYVDGNGFKRWRLIDRQPRRILNVTSDELADLEGAVAQLRQDKQITRANSLTRLADKIRATMPDNELRKLGPDLEALLTSEGAAMVPGPQPKISEQVVAELRQAIKGANIVHIDFRGSDDDQIRKFVARPYGFLFGHRHYLVAKVTEMDGKAVKADNPWTLTLGKIVSVDIQDEMFEIPEDFSLKEFAQRSFGVFQGEELVDVAWKFNKKVASRAKEFQFHPSQTSQEQADGSLIVRFRASSKTEMAWQLYKWGNNVEVLEPADLAAMVADYRPDWKQVIP